MKRREFLGVLGGAAAAWPLTAVAQQSAPSTVGYLGVSSAESNPQLVTAFRRGLSEVGYVEGRNLEVQYRWAKGDLALLSTMAADLVSHRVAVIAAFSNPAALAAKAATTTIPVVFATGADPVAAGLVSSVNRPGGHMTGISFMGNASGGKKWNLIRDTITKTGPIGVLSNPRNLANNSEVADAQISARATGDHIEIFKATNDQEIDAAFEAMRQIRAVALICTSDPYFFSRRSHLLKVAAHHSIPAIYGQREFPLDGALMSYGPTLSDVWRRVGGYVGRIIKGENAGDLPVELPTKYEFVINLKAAKSLGIELPSKILALADEVIE